MWICIKAIEKKIEMIGTADKLDEILQIMYEDLAEAYPSEGHMIDAINADEAEICNSDYFAWCKIGNYREQTVAWQCFWV